MKIPLADALRAVRCLAQDLASILYPPYCEICESPCSPESALCENCQQSARRLLPPKCQTCGEPFSGALQGAFSCPNCADRTFAFDFALASYLSEGCMRELIHRFKYGKKSYLARPLAHLALQALDDPRIDPSQSWLLIPVPLHPRRLRERGFNQSEELVRELARLTKWTHLNPLRRMRYTTTQAHLSRNQRLLNIRKAIALRPRIDRSLLADQSILLIDDVFTTGATADACARVLKREANAKSVIVLTVLRG